MIASLHPKSSVFCSPYYLRFSVFLPLVFLFCMLSFNAMAQVPPLIPDRMVTNGAVTTINVSANNVYIGGNFTYVGYKAAYGTVLNTDGSRKWQNDIQLNGDVYCQTSDGAGGWIIGGSFTSVLGQSRGRLAWIKADGTLHSFNVMADRVIRKMERIGNTLYIAGDFSAINGVTQRNLAAIDLSSQTVLAWNPNLNGAVFCMLISGGRMYIGGGFNHVGGTPCAYFACLNLANAALIPGAVPAPNNAVRAMALNGNTLYVGGNFTIWSNTINRNTAAAIDLTTGKLTNWDPKFENGAIVYALAVAGGKLFAGGNFNNINSISRKNLASFDLSSHTLTAWKPDADLTVNMFATSSTALYVAGQFTKLLNMGTERRGGAAFDVATGQLLNWHPRIDDIGFTISLAVNGSEVFIGGTFRLIHAEKRSSAAAFNGLTGELLPWDPVIGGRINCMKIVGSAVYLGGFFNSVGTGAGQAFRSHTAAVDLNTAAPLAWDPKANNEVYALDVNGADAYIGGAFTTVGSTARNRLAAVNASTGAVNTAFNATPNSVVSSVVKYGAYVFAGGSFTTINAATCAGFAILDANTGTRIPFGSSGTVETLVLRGSKMYIGGSFASMGGKAKSNIAEMDLVTRTITDWAVSTDGSVNDILPAANGLFISGSFSKVNNTEQASIAEVRYNGTVTGWKPLCYQVSALGILNDHLYVGGFFSNFNNNYNKSNLAVVSVNNSLPLTWGQFIAIPKNGLVTLQWSTVQEINTKDFTVQHSKDGVRWKDIGRMGAAGNSSTLQQYEFVHPTPANGLNQYRLLQRDMDEQNSYSKIISVRLSSNNESFTILENPVKGSTLKMQSSQPVMLLLFGSDGKLFLQKNIPAGSHQIDVTHLPAGVYLLKTGVHTQQIVIQ